MRGNYRVWWLLVPSLVMSTVAIIISLVKLLQ